MTMNGITPPPVGNHPQAHPGIKWFFIIIFGIIFVFGLLIAVYFFAGNDQMGAVSYTHLTLPTNREV